MTMTHRIAISGATGFVGSNLIKTFRERSWDVVPIGRDDFKLAPEALAEKMKGVDIVVNLAGAPVAARWTEAYKKIMYDSRINVTRAIVNACSRMDQKPDLLISTSAVGIYASLGVHTEKEHTIADDFLGKLAQDWESEAFKTRAQGIRTVIFRFGIVLGRDGGALQQMLMPFKLGIGGTLGDGSQDFSWIHIQDLIRAYVTVIENKAYEGIYNLTSPNQSTNRELTRALGLALGRPALLRIPKFVLQMQLGEGAQVLMSGQRVIPKRLIDSGFAFRFTDIEEAVRDCVS